MENTANVENTQDLTPSIVTVEELMAQLKATQEHASKLEEKNKDLVQKDLRRQEEALLEERAKKESRFNPTRTTMVIRRLGKDGMAEIAPAQEVLDYLELWDLKDPHTEQGKKTRVSEEDLEIYQELKKEVSEAVTYEVFAERLKELTGDKNPDIDESDDEVEEQDEM